MFLVNDLWCTIFTFLHIHEYHVCTLPRVCKAFRRCCLTSAAWDKRQYVHIAHSKNAAKILECAPWVQRVSCSNLTTNGIESLAKLPLRRLSVSVVNSDYPPMLRAMRQLTHLYMNFEVKSLMKFPITPCVLPRLPAIRALSLSNAFITIDSLRYNISAPTLKSCTILHGMISSDTLSYMSRSVERIRIQGTSIGELHLSNLNRCTKLRKLDLCYNHSLEITTIVEVSLPNLTTLRLDHSPISNESLVLLHTIHSLKTLTINSCQKITIDGVNCISLIPSLTHLEMQRCFQIHGSCVECLERLTNLEKLAISCRFSPDEMDRLSRMSSLRSLDLKWSGNISGTYLRMLAKLPNLQYLRHGPNSNFFNPVQLEDFSELSTLNELTLFQWPTLEIRDLDRLVKMESLTRLILVDCFAIQKPSCDFAWKEPGGAGVLPFIEQHVHKENESATVTAKTSWKEVKGRSVRGRRTRKQTRQTKSS